MIADEILAQPARVLSQSDRERYFERGYLCVPDVIPASLMAELTAVTDEFVDASRAHSESGFRVSIANIHQWLWLQWGLPPEHSDMESQRA